MSIRRAVEYNMKVRIDPTFQGSVYKIVESLRQEERPVPGILIVAGDAVPAYDVGDYTGNYMVPFNVVILSNVDKQTVDEHNNTVQQVIGILRDPNSRGQSVIDGLYLYAIHTQGIAEDNGDRKMGVVISYQAVVNYAPDLSSDPANNPPGA